MMGIREQESKYKTKRQRENEQEKPYSWNRYIKLRGS